MNIPHELEQWRKGVDLIRGPLVKFAGKNLPTLCCVAISRAVLEVLAETEKLRAQLAAVTAYRDGMIAAFSKLYGPEVQVDEHASTLARLIVESHTLADIALELMDTEHGAEGSLAEAVRVLMSSLAAATAQRDELLRVAKEAEEVLTLMERPRIEDPSYGAEVRALGDRIGFGVLMSSASASWRRRLKEGGLEGGERCSGPCHATVLMTLKVVREAIARAQPEQPQQPKEEP